MPLRGLGLAESRSLRALTVRLAVRAGVTVTVSETPTGTSSIEGPDGEATVQVNGVDVTITPNETLALLSKSVDLHIVNQEKGGGLLWGRQ